MLAPLALLLSAVILGTTGSVVKDNKDVGVKEVFQGREYLYDATPRNWTEAFQFCNGVGESGHLAVIGSDADKAVIRTMMAKNGATSIHLGFHDRYLEGEYYTVTNMPIQAIQWAVGSPKGGVAYNCGGFTAAGFEDTDCADKRATICEYRRPEAYGYFLLPGHNYYKYHNLGVTWVEAWKTCKSEGAYLHILNSQEEQNALYSRFTYSSVWVGVTRQNANNNNEFHTIFDVPLNDTGFSIWYDLAQPEGTFISHPYVYSFVNQRLATQRSTKVYPFICEKNLS